MRILEDEKLLENTTAMGEYILEQFEVLRELDTSSVIPTGHAGNLETVMRDDLPGDCLTAEQVVSNAPRTEEDLIRVKAVLEE